VVYVLCYMLLVIKASHEITQRGCKPPHLSWQYPVNTIHYTCCNVFQETTFYPLRTSRKSVNNIFLDHLRSFCISYCHLLAHGFDSRRLHQVLYIIKKRSDINGIRQIGLIFYPPSLSTQVTTRGRKWALFVLILPTFIRPPPGISLDFVFQKTSEGLSAKASSGILSGLAHCVLRSTGHGALLHIFNDYL
jgi:hypothetical protein